MGDFADRGSAAGHQQPDRLLDLFRERTSTWVDHGGDQLTSESGHSLVRARQWPFQILSSNDDSIEVRSELHRAVEQPIVGRAILGPRAFVTEAYALRAPAFGHDRPA